MYYDQLPALPPKIPPHQKFEGSCVYALHSDKFFRNFVDNTNFFMLLHFKYSM